MNICIVLPALNEGERLRSLLRGLNTPATGVPLVLVETRLRKAVRIGSMDRGVKGLTLIRNRRLGLGLALRTGLAYARDRGYSGVITMDGNGKDGVDAIPRFIEKLEEGYDLVQGSRFMPGGHHEHTPKDRLFGIKRIVAPAVRHAGGYPFTDPTNGFRGLSMRLIGHAGMDLFRPCLVRFNFRLYLLCNIDLFGENHLNIKNGGGDFEH